jgi:hypothetical protein
MNGFPLGTRAAMYKAHETILHSDNTIILKIQKNRSHEKQTAKGYDLFT